MLYSSTPLAFFPSLIRVKSSVAKSGSPFTEANLKVLSGKAIWVPPPAGENTGENRFAVILVPGLLPSLQVELKLLKPLALTWFSASRFKSDINPVVDVS